MKINTALGGTGALITEKRMKKMGRQGNEKVL